MNPCIEKGCLYSSITKLGGCDLYDSDYTPETCPYFRYEAEVPSEERLEWELRKLLSSKWKLDLLSYKFKILSAYKCKNGHVAYVAFSLGRERVLLREVKIDDEGFVVDVGEIKLQ